MANNNDDLANAKTFVFIFNEVQDLLDLKGIKNNLARINNEYLGDIQNINKKKIINDYLFDADIIIQKYPQYLKFCYDIFRQVENLSVSQRIRAIREILKNSELLLTKEERELLIKRILTLFEIKNIKKIRKRNLNEYSDKELLELVRDLM